MPLAQELKQAMVAAMKARDTARRDILRVALSDVQAETERKGGTLADPDAFKVLKRMVKSMDETIAAAPGSPVADKAKSERQVLAEFLPQTWSADQIRAALEPQADALRAAGNDGQAMGVAMKTLKSQGAEVDGGDVRQVVAAIRAG
ncbi:MAG: GatB/YqeY domain-containing protein [Planctomycetota bacterium]